jgi:hypothetical protein
VQVSSLEVDLFVLGRSIGIGRLLPVLDDAPQLAGSARAASSSRS